MPITAKAASDKINELRSKLAIYSTWTETIQANYMPSDGAGPETRITRDDGGNVTEHHLQAVLDEIEERSGELREELAEWEGLVFEPKQAEVREIKPEQGEEPKKVERKLGARRIHQAAK